MQVDVLVVAALPEELEAARAAGVTDWREHRPGPYLRGDFHTSEGQTFSVALTRPVQVGGRATAPYVTGLVERLRPSCVAMCGVCAGNPDVTALGDVVVAEPVYEWDEGKLLDTGFVGDHRQFRLDPRWLREAQNLDPGRLPSYGAATEDEALMWLLERLHRGHDPRSHPARPRYFPSGTWGPRLDRWQSAGWLTRDPNGTPRLAEAASDLVQRRLYDDVDGPRRLPFAVKAAPMASGSAVVADGRIWGQLAAMGMRNIAAVEMEAATIATIAHDRGVPRWLVVKGVMDHANADKDDRYKEFAARASAEVLFALLDKVAADLPSSPPPLAAEPARPAGDGSLSGLRAIVAALLDIPTVQDDVDRRTVLGLLPQRIRTQVPDNPVGRLHVLGLVQTCQRFPDGAQALLGALHLALGEDSPEVERIAAVIDEHWTQR
jgi:nucleoside phosphorylase